MFFTINLDGIQIFIKDLNPKYVDIVNAINLVDAVNIVKSPKRQQNSVYINQFTIPLISKLKLETLRQS